MQLAFIYLLAAFFQASLPADRSAADVVVTVLGIAQDGGYPQMGCRQECCLALQKKPEQRLYTASLLVQSGVKSWLIDATPDLPDQVALAEFVPRSPTVEGRRPPLFDGIFLTHAHMGHYAGLIHLGREAYHHPIIPVYGSQRMRTFLTTNQPWQLLVKNENIRPQALVPQRPFSLTPDLIITPIPVPHRDEITDTFAYKISGPSRSLLYIPDIDKWSRWERKIEDLIAEVDLALLDGTFFADGEIPGVSMAAIPHPFIEESMQRFATLPATERAKVVFIHLNHTNPAIRPENEAAQRVIEAGMRIAVQGEKILL